jgi:hypothetical protein
LLLILISLAKIEKSGVPSLLTCMYHKLTALSLFLIQLWVWMLREWTWYLNKSMHRLSLSLTPTETICYKTRKSQANATNLVKSNKTNKPHLTSMPVLHTLHEHKIYYSYCS